MKHFYKLSLLTLIVVSLTTPSVGFGKKSRRVSGTLGQAKFMFDRKNYAEAARLYYSATTALTGAAKQKAEFALAESLRRMDLLYASTFVYSRIIVQGQKHRYYGPALERLAYINSQVSIGKASISMLLNDRNINPLSVPNKARGFYFFYKGLSAFEDNKIPLAKSSLTRVPTDGYYFPLAQYYLGTMAIIGKDQDEAINSFNRTLKSAQSDDVKELAVMNLGHVYFEKKDYRRALEYYSRIPRNSDNWLDALFAGGYAFFHRQQHNESLGNIHTIHSPFFYQRFYPETYILNAFTYLRLCRYPRVQKELEDFRTRYKPTFDDLKKMLQEYKGNYKEFFNLVYDYKDKSKMSKFANAVEVVDSVSRTQAFKETKVIIQQIDEEKSRLQKYSTQWAENGLNEILSKFLEAKQGVSKERSGKDVYFQTADNYNYLLRLSNETRLINLEVLSGNTDKIRSDYLSEPVAGDGLVWGEGMRPLNLKQSMEYWPFQGEYWENELGFYRYNIDSQCKTKGSS